MSQFSDEERNYILRNVRNELHHMDSAKKRIVTRNENSFAQWARSAVVSVARGFGYIISVPFRVVGEIVSGIWRALFG